MALFGKPKKKTSPFTVPTDIGWIKSPRGNFYKFLGMDPYILGLEGISAVYVIWHGGLRPEWLYVGHSDDLAATFETHREDNEIRNYDGQGGLYVTWAMIRPEYQVGVCRYLIRTLQPLIFNPEEFDEEEPSIPVYPPGVEAPQN